MTRLLPLGLGLAALALGTAAGWDPGLLDALVTPPALVRAGLIGAMVVLGLWLLRSAVVRLRGSGRPALGGSVEAADLPVMLRGIRLVFLALAAFAAAAGWLLAHPLPLVVAAVIAGVDVVETSFLLLVVAARRAPGPPARER